MFEEYKNYTKFIGKAILAIDYGTKRSGLSSYIPGKDPYPLSLCTIDTLAPKEKNHEIFLQKLAKIVSENTIDVIVLGLPLHLDASMSKAGLKMQKLAQRIKEHLPRLSLYLQDEALSSFEAEERMKHSALYNFKVKKEDIDLISAVIILEDFIKSPQLYEVF